MKRLKRIVKLVIEYEEVIEVMVLTICALSILWVMLIFTVAVLG